MSTPRTTVERILEAREQAHLDAESYALRLGLPLLFRYYCRACHHHHQARSGVGQAHEHKAANPRAVQAAKREHLRLVQP